MNKTTIHKCGMIYELVNKELQKAFAQELAEQCNQPLAIFIDGNSYLNGELVATYEGIIE